MKKVSKSLLAEIQRLESVIESRSASEDLVNEVDLDLEMGEGAVVANFIDDELSLDIDEDPMFEDENVVFDDFTDVEDVDEGDISEAIDEIYASSRAASETEEGIEDEITQDADDEVAEEVGAEDIATHDSVKEVTASRVDRLKEASMRLDRVASYLERKGQVKLAYRIDRLADALDMEISKL